MSVQKKNGWLKMSLVSKINIDELMDVLMELRRVTQYIDVRIDQEENTIRLRKWEPEPPEDIPPPRQDEGDEGFLDIDKLIG